MAGLVLEKVSRVYSGSVVALEALSLDVADGELVVLVGPSGSGKSTTLRLIAGLEQPSSGQIRIDGRAAEGMPPKERNIAMVFQNDALYPHLTVQENIEFGWRLRAGGGWLGRIFGRAGRAVADAGETADEKRADERVADKMHVARQMAVRLGVAHLLDRLPRQLSGGERQRVALARALVRRPALFLFDEPLSNLDAPLRAELRREIKRLHQGRRATIVYVTHDQVEALTLGERIVVLDRGVVQQVGTPAEVYGRPQNLFVARFIGSPPMNLVAGRLEPAAGGWGFRHGDWRLDLSAGKLGRQLATGPPGVNLQQYIDRPQRERPVVLGVRPEYVGLRAEPADSDAGGGLRGILELVEPLGDSTVVTVTVGPTESCEPLTLVSKLGPQVAWRVGEAAAITIDPEHVQWFDAATGLNLSWQ